jgi:histidinol phosphate phosphatase HisJ family
MYDYHNHTSFSHDSSANIDAVIEAGIRRGLKQVAITDHYDPEYANPAVNTYIDLEYYFEELKQKEEQYAGRINVIKGIEFGLQDHILEQLRLAAASHPYDFILGSFHCADGSDLYRSGYYENRADVEIYRGFYKYCIKVLYEFDDFDVMGHVNIVERYSPVVPAFGTYGDLIEELFKMLIERGKGIELNTSSIRYGMGVNYTPSVTMLTLYRKMGGEIITIGSDSHCMEDVGRDTEFAAELLKNLGFKYRTLFKGRKPEFILL